MKPVAFYFDYASPWAYLANELIARKLPGVTFTYHPIYLRGLEAFSKGLPYTGPKLAYLARDIARCAAFENVTLVPPATFPIDGLHALRAAYVAQDSHVFDRYHRAAFRAAWAEQRDISKKELVAAILADALGATEAAALEAMSDPRIKERLREASADAENRGVFGTPTFFVGGEMFWGHDRMEYVAREAHE